MHATQHVEEIEDEIARLSKSGQGGDQVSFQHIKHIPIPRRMCFTTMLPPPMNGLSRVSDVI